ncbi:protease inhibitor 1-like [Sphaerodactylus townsendi]|uniref:Uncharacterized protein n=1 Tax=Sphaerodactylus townsendi TaxID=933632 RepID=A0ACB8F800_9SAUR|nr:protease inhibitor 1-like [Sphaerodactylus townsendi]
MHCTGLFLLLGLCAFWAELAPASGQGPPAGKRGPLLSPPALLWSNGQNARGLSAAGVPKRCRLPPETGPCKMRIERYYYDHAKRTCLEFTYGGCRGNSNNFHTKEECMGACAYPRKGAV